MTETGLFSANTVYLAHLYYVIYYFFLSHEAMNFFLIWYILIGISIKI